MPTYLHDRPKAVTLHCLDRKATSSQFGAEDVLTVSSSGVFEVKNIICTKLFSITTIDLPPI